MAGRSAPSRFWWPAASPLRLRLRRGCWAAGESSPCCCSSRRRQQCGGECFQGGKRGFKTEAVLGCGVKVGDLWCSPQIWSRWSSGAAPGRCSFFVVSSSFSELDFLAARQRLRARGSAAPVVVVLGGRHLRRLRRRRVRASVDLEVEDGECELRRLLFPLLPLDRKSVV